MEHLGFFFAVLGRLSVVLLHTVRVAKQKIICLLKPLKHQIQCELLVSNVQLALNLFWLKYTFQGLT